MVSPRSARSRSLALLLLILPSIANAQPDGREAEAKAKEAKTACLANRPDRGIEILAELYAETNDPTYIYNQGRCYQQNGRSADAVLRFREYLRKATAIAPGEKAEVERIIAELEEQERRRSPLTPLGQPAPTPPPGAASPAAPPAAAVPPGPAVTVETTMPASRPDRRPLRIAGLVSAGVGALALVGGVYMGHRAQQLSEEVTADARNMMFSQSKYEEGERAELLQWVGYGVGGVALLTGGLLYAAGLGLFDGETRAVAAVPTLGPHGGGASLRITF